VVFLLRGAGGLKGVGVGVVVISGNSECTGLGEPMRGGDDARLLSFDEIGFPL